MIDIGICWGLQGIELWKIVVRVLEGIEIFFDIEVVVLFIVFNNLKLLFLMRFIIESMMGDGGEIDCRLVVYDDVDYYGIVRIGLIEGFLL